MFLFCLGRFVLGEYRRERVKEVGFCRIRFLFFDFSGVCLIVWEMSRKGRILIFFCWIFKFFLLCFLMGLRVLEEWGELFFF